MDTRTILMLVSCCIGFVLFALFAVGCRAGFIIFGGVTDKSNVAWSFGIASVIYCALAGWLLYRNTNIFRRRSQYESLDDINDDDEDVE